MTEGWVTRGGRTRYVSLTSTPALVRVSVVRDRYGLRYTARVTICYTGWPFVAGVIGSNLSDLRAKVRAL